jgi:hypothetical protein
MFLGEFSVTKNADRVSRFKYTSFIVSETESQGMIWAYWSFADEHRGLYDPVNNTWKLELFNALFPVDVQRDCHNIRFFNRRKKR